MSTPRFRFEHGAHFVLKDRILPEHHEHEAKSSAQNEHGAARFRSCYFTIFCVNILTKSDKRFIIGLQINIGIQEHGFAGYFARSTEKRGVKPRRRTAL